MDKKVQIIYKKLTQSFKTKEYISLNDLQINNQEDLVEIANIFRNPEYETFRMIYVKDEKIVGYESISSKNPSCVYLFRNKKTGDIDIKKGIYGIKERMRRLDADGYYMVHNHPSGNATASNKDIAVTKYFTSKINGFKGHLIISTDTYSWIEKNKKGLNIENNLPINFKKADKMSKMLNKKSIYNVQITNRDDLVSLMQNIQNSQDYSIAILTDSIGQVRMILDIPNTTINQELKQLNGYFRNLARQNGAIRVFFATNNNETFNKSLEHLSFGTFKDSICYKDIDNSKIAYKAAPEIPIKTLFENEINLRKKAKLNFGNIVFSDNVHIPNCGYMEIGLNDNDDEYIHIPLEENNIGTPDFSREL